MPGIGDDWYQQGRRQQQWRARHGDEPQPTPADPVAAGRAAAAEEMRRTIEGWNPASRALLSGATGFAETASFGLLPRERIYRMAGADPAMAGIAGEATRESEAAHPWTAGLASQIGGLAGMTTGAGAISGILGRTALPLVGRYAAEGIEKGLAEPMIRQVARSSAAFGAQQAITRGAGQVAYRSATGQPQDYLESAGQAVRGGVRGAIEGAAFPVAGQIAKNLAGRAVGIKPGFQPTRLQAIGRDVIGESAFFSGLSAATAEPGHRLEAAAQGALAGPLAAAGGWGRLIRGEIPREGLTPAEAAELGPQIAQAEVESRGLQGANDFLGSPAAIKRYGPVAMTARAAMHAAPEMYAKLDPTLDRAKAPIFRPERVAASPNLKALLDDPVVGSVYRDENSPADLKAFFDRKIPSYLMPKEPDTVLTPKEKAIQPAFGELPQEAFRRAGADIVETKRGTLAVWPDLVSDVLKNDKGSSKKLIEARIQQPITDKTKFTHGGLVDAVKALAETDSLGEVLGYGEGHATKIGKDVMVTGRDEKGFETRSVLTTQEGKAVAIKNLMRAGAKRVEVRDATATPEIIGERVTTAATPDGPVSALPEAQAGRSAEPAPKLGEGRTPTLSTTSGRQVKVEFHPSGSAPGRIAEEVVGHHESREGALAAAAEANAKTQGKGPQITVKPGKDEWLTVKPLAFGGAGAEDAQKALAARGQQEIQDRLVEQAVGELAQQEPPPALPATAPPAAPEPRPTAGQPPAMPEASHPVQKAPTAAPRSAESKAPDREPKAPVRETIAPPPETIPTSRETMEPQHGTEVAEPRESTVQQPTGAEDVTEPATLERPEPRSARPERARVEPEPERAAPGAPRGEEPGGRPEGTGGGAVEREPGHRGDDRGGAERPGGVKPGRILSTLVPTREGSPERIPADLVRHLNEHQVAGVGHALAALEDENRAERGFLFADGTGVGKTREILAVAEKYRREGKAVVIVGPAKLGPKGKPIYKSSLASEAEVMGVQLDWIAGGSASKGRVSTTAYQYLGKLKVPKGSVLLFDEAHSLKNADAQQTNHALKLIDDADAVVFASATMADKPTHVAYLARAGALEGRSVAEQLAHLGMRLEVSEVFNKKLGYKVEVRKWVPDPQAKSPTGNLRGMEEVIRRLRLLTQRLADKGKVVKREISMDGVGVTVDHVKMPKEWEDVHAKLRAKFDGTVLQTHENIQQEPFKIPRVVEMVNEELKAGRSVVVFAARVNESEAVKKHAIRNHLGEVIDTREEVVARSEGTLKTLKEKLIAAGLAESDIGEIHGGVTAKVQEQAKDEFQSNKTRVVIATAESGGVGINLDDTVGGHPRTMIVMTAPYSGVTNAQAWGRIWRLNTKGDAKIRYVFAETSVDARRAAIVTKKMLMLGATLQGEHKRLMEVVDGMTDIPDAAIAEVFGDGVKPAASAAPGSIRKIPVIPLESGAERGLMGEIRAKWAKSDKDVMVKARVMDAGRAVVEKLKSVGVDARFREKDGMILVRRSAPKDAEPKAQDMIRTESVETAEPKSLRDMVKRSDEISPLEEIQAKLAMRLVDRPQDAEEIGPVLDELSAKIDELYRKGKKPC